MFLLPHAPTKTEQLLLLVGLLIIHLKRSVKSRISVNKTLVLSCFHKKVNTVKSSFADFMCTVSVYMNVLQEPRLYFPS